MNKMCKLIAASVLVLSSVISYGADEEEIRAEDAIWLQFDFENGLKPAGKAKDNVEVEFKRPCKIFLTNKTVIEENVPYLVNGFQGGKALYIGRTTENLLPADVATMNLTEKNDIVKSLEDVPYKIIHSEKEALFDKTCLYANAKEKIRGGVAIDVDIEGGMYNDKAYHIFVLSFYVKGKGKVQVDIGIDEGVHDYPKFLKLTDQWQRVSLWVAAKKKTKSTLTFRNHAGEECEFYLDGLQLEKKHKIDALINKHQMTISGNEFSTGPWMPGKTKYLCDLFKIRLKKEFMFPIEEGSINLWLKPLFYRNDAEFHEIFYSRKWFYEFVFGSNSLDFFRDGRDEKKNAVSVERPKSMKIREWGMVTATWSNKKERINVYFNGRRLGFHKSEEIEINRDPEIDEDDKIEQIVNEVWSIIIGSHGEDHHNGLHGVIDNFTIYNKALTQEEIEKLYPFDKEDDI